MGQYLCIDLKSFYASCECVMRGLDPFKTPLVVADESRGSGSIVLAVSPYLKKVYNIPSRCRLFEIPKNIAYIAAKPRMRKYIWYSTKVYECFLKYVSADDIHVYSIDEVFIHIAPYLNLYRKDAVEIGEMLIREIKNSLGLTATCGIGENMYLAKVALDIMAKHDPIGIAYLNKDIFISKLWHHKRLEDFWQIGKGTVNHLAKLGIFTLRDIAFYGREKLVKEFGVLGNDLYDRAWGDDDVKIEDIKRYQPKSKSMTRGQVLFKDYTKKEARIVLLEMLYSLSLDLIKKQQRCNIISLFIGYSKEIGLGMRKNLTLPYSMSSYNRLKEYFLMLFDCIDDLPIRRIHISFSGLTSDRQMCLFEEDTKVYEAINSVCEKYGKNAILLGLCIEKKATLKVRNLQIGGHHE